MFLYALFWLYLQKFKRLWLDDCTKRVCMALEQMIYMYLYFYCIVYIRNKTSLQLCSSHNNQKHTTIIWILSAIIIIFVFVINTSLLKPFDIWKCDGKHICRYCNVSTLVAFYILNIMYPYNKCTEFTRTWPFSYPEGLYIHIVYGGKLLYWRHFYFKAMDNFGFPVRYVTVSV